MFQVRQHLDDFISLAAVTQNHDDVIWIHNTQAPVQRVGRMQIKRRRASAGHGGRDLLRDDSGFANTQKNNLAFAVSQQSYDPLKLIVVEAGRSLGDSLGLKAQKIDNFRKIGHSGTLVYDSDGDFASDLGTGSDRDCVKTNFH